MAWVAGAVEETLAPGSAWDLLHAELIDQLAVAVRKSHAACAPPVGEQSAAPALAEAARYAGALLRRQERLAARQRDSVAGVALRALHVRRAADRFIAGGRRNVRARLAAAHAAAKAAEKAAAAAGAASLAEAEVKYLSEATAYSQTMTEGLLEKEENLFLEIHSLTEDAGGE